MNLEKDALKRIEHIFATYNPSEIFMGHSGGKDSCTILHLTKRIEPNIKIIHNVKPLLGTSGDPVAALTEMHPETLNFMYTEVCKEEKVTFMHWSKMEAYVAEQGLKVQFDGARIAEAFRPGKSSNFIMNGVSVNRQHLVEVVHNGMFGLTVSYPIFDWSDRDVFDYLQKYIVPISNEYVVNGELKEYFDAEWK